MKKPDFIELNSLVSKALNLNPLVKQAIDRYVMKVSEYFADAIYDVRKLGDYAAKTLIATDFLRINIAVVHHFPKNERNAYNELIKAVSTCLKNVFSENDIVDCHDQGYYEVAIMIDDKPLTLVINAFLEVKDDKQGNFTRYLFYYNEKEKSDYCQNVITAFNTINKISNNTMRTLVKLIKYCLRNEFEYTYILYELCLRWFYEYFLRHLQISFAASMQEGEEDYRYWEQTEFLKKWFAKNIDVNELFFYILNRLWKKENYYFREFEFIEEDIFESISRYSWYSNSCFLTPYDYYLGFRVFNLQDYDHLSYVQENLGNDLLSRVCYDDTRNGERRFFITPLKINGVAGFNEYAHAFKQKQAQLYKFLPEDQRSSAVNLNKREVMNELNLIAHRWLTSYKNRAVYIKTYFDAKYSILNNMNYFLKIQAIMQAIDALDNKDFVVGCDN